MHKQQTIKHSAVVGAAVALLLISAAFNNQAWAIAGGESDAGRHPNVGVLIAFHPDLGVFTFCSGTLIYPQVFLTAGHAPAMAESLGFTILGVSFDQEPNLEDPATWVPVSRVEANLWATGANRTGGGAGIGSADIAAYILQDPVQGITPEPLPPLALLDQLKKTGQLQAGPDRTKFTVVGYGMLLNWAPPQPYWENPPRRNLAQSGYLGFNETWLSLNQNLAAGYGGTGEGRFRRPRVLDRSRHRRGDPGRPHVLGRIAGRERLVLPHRHCGGPGIPPRRD